MSELNTGKKSGFNPLQVYKQSSEHNPLKLFISPSQYIQGAGIISRTGLFISVITSKTAGILITPGRDKAIGDSVRASLKSAGLDSESLLFGGESSIPEVYRIVDFFKQSKKNIGCIVGVGGGKCLDAGRMVSERFSVPFISIPTTAATDAPTAAHSVIYDTSGVFLDIEFHKTNPSMVIVDTDIITQAPLRYMVSGMGDALSTYYEAICCAMNPEARLVRGARPSVAALAIAQRCREVLFENGIAAVETLEKGERNDAVEKVIEANILLSGLGFESGGLAASHAVAQGLTADNRLHEKFLHGELVAIGVMTQLILEKNISEAEKVAEFLSAVGLPASLIQLGVNPETEKEVIDKVVERALGVSFLYNEPFEITAKSLKNAIIEASKFGSKKTDQFTQSRFKTLHQT